MPRALGSRLEQESSRIWLCSYALLMVASLVGAIYFVYKIQTDSTAGALVFVSGVSLSSFDVSPSSRQLNGTWHIDFSLLYKGLTSWSFSCNSAAVSMYYKGTYLAGANLQAFRVTRKHSIPLEVNVDASRNNVPDWLASNLTEVRRLKVMEFEVQFVAKHDLGLDTYLCRGLRLGFSTTNEAKLIGDGHVRCPLIA